ncbi:MAG: tRNA (N(6)-L-threonylcarbamoyladenosine(37)-C(2))-methylthiotransferase MtaB [Firmicutes bacterium]|nr:tRNA (N(6)-L-threonylcarbamoyladenosine(37)-C(2))-methylthiotransferase MtaB [Bacillota bacterium]
MATAAYYTLGCKVNQTETAALQHLLEKRGYQTVSFTEPADVYIINTCTVTHLGDRKSRQMVRRARRTNPDAVIVVTGCYAQVSPREVMKLPEVDLIVGTHAREQLPDLIKRAKTERIVHVFPLTEKKEFEGLDAAQTGEKTRAFLKVQEGCRQFCSYCIVPYARGPLYSRPVAETVKIAVKLAAEGFRELVLTGVHLGSYGAGLDGDVSLCDLLQELVKVEGLDRIRISSVEPTEVTDRLVELLLAEPKICPHLHLPLQSGDDEILRRMNRRYTAAEFLNLVERLRSRIPDLALTTDVMVGFPGESEAQFANTLQVVRRAEFSRLHVFKYSPRRGTPAAKYKDQIPAPVKEARSRKLLAAGRELAAAYHRRFVGKTETVLFEDTVGEGEIAGFTRHYVRVAVAAPKDRLGELLPVHMTESSAAGLRGEILATQ